MKATPSCVLALALLVVPVPASASVLGSGISDLARQTSSLVQDVHWRSYWHCHWIDGYRTCHNGGGYVYRGAYRHHRPWIHRDHWGHRGHWGHHGGRRR